MEFACRNKSEYIVFNLIRYISTWTQWLIIRSAVFLSPIFTYTSEFNGFLNARPINCVATIS